MTDITRSRIVNGLTLMTLMDSIRQAFGGRRGGHHGSPRQAVRLMISHPVRLRAANAALDQPAILEDLSSSGACIRTSQHLRSGESVVLNVNLSPEMRFEQAAKIVYVQRSQNSYQARCGLRFVELRPEIRMRIANYIAQERHGRTYGVQPFSRGAEPA